MELKPETAVKTVFLCGALTMAGSMASFVKDVQENKPTTFIADDGHQGVALNGSQSLKALGGVAGGTIAATALMFGAALRKEKERAALAAAQAKTR